MAKKQSTKSTAQEQTAQRIKRTEAYAEKVRKQFAATANAILDLNKQMPTLDTGVMFSFDAQSNRTRAKVEGLLRQLHSVCVAAIQNGIKLEWEQANTEVDKLISSTFGKEILDNPKFTAWTNRNETAMQAFITRSEKGLNLSDRVWKPVRQLRDEMEVAITVAIGEGQSASQMSRKVREYLNDPDLMFRRFRYKDPETGEWKRKWKKRIKDETTGKNRWIDYDKDDYKTGAGVYKSSAKNAMRVTRTETNIAYRRADNERWQAMDFVLGQRIELSHSHPKTDICDKLQGDYPKTFIFDGWHPQCFCFAVPILADWEEQKKMEDAMIKGEKYVSPNLITDYPQEFKDWVEEHGEQIEAARERGTEPYFIRNNAKVIDNILYPDAKPSIADIAKARHEARTPEKEKMLRDYWQKKVAEGEARRKHQAVLDAAAKRHAERTPEQITAIKQAWNTRKATFHYGQNMLNVMGGISDVDTSALADALKHGNQTAILAEAANLKAIGKQIMSYDNLVNPLQVAKDFSMAEAKAVQDAVSKTINTWLKKFGYADWEAAPLMHKKNKLEQEINALIQSKKYSTWEVAQKAYLKKLAPVQDALDFETFTNTLSEHKQFLKDSKTKSPIYKNGIKSLEAAIAAKDKAAAQLAIAELDAKKIELEKKYAAKKTTSAASAPSSTNETEQKGHIGSGLTTQERINKIKELTGISDDAVARDYNDAVYGFSWQWDYEIRQVQCGNSVTSRHGHTLEQITKKAKDLEEFIAKSPQWNGGTTYRGMSLSPMELDNLRKEMKAGAGNMLGSASWSTKESVSRGFASSHIGETSPVFGDTKTKKVLLVTKHHKKATSIKHLSNFPSEDEVLASLACRYKFVGEEVKGEFIYITVEPK